jgi:hypothetical protein
MSDRFMEKPLAMVTETAEIADRRLNENANHFHITGFTSRHRRQLKIRRLLDAAMAGGEAA